MTRWLCVVVLTACSSGPAPSDPAALRADARALQAAIAEDRSSGPFHDVDVAVSDRRPVLAAELIRNSGIPALERARRAVAAAATRTREGNAAREGLLAAYDEHLRTAANYARMLDRGEVEDIELLHAVHDERVAEQTMERATAAVTRLGALR